MIMKTPPHYLIWNWNPSHIPALHPPAVRTATFGSWRMLTLGAEYEGIWALPPDRRRTQPKYAEAPPEETDICAAGCVGPSWGPAHDGPTHKFDTVLHLEGAEEAGPGGGVRWAVWTHEALNSSPLTHARFVSVAQFYSHTSPIDSSTTDCFSCLWNYFFTHNSKQADTHFVTDNWICWPSN